MNKPLMTLIDRLPIEGRRTLIRVDLNVPLENGVIADDSRIVAALPTIKHAVSRGARVILVSHLGRPKGETVPSLSLAPIGSYLAEALKCDVILPEEPLGEVSLRLAQDLRDGDVLLLENVRFNEGETKNDDGCARALAALAECYVNDAFGAAHRSHASTVGITAHVRDKAMGFLMAKEVESLTKLLKAPKQGFVAILGGAKVSDKIKVINRLLDRVDTLLIGGAMAYTFLKAQGIDVGASRVEEEHISTAREVLVQAGHKGVNIRLPVDHVCATEFAEDAKAIISEQRIDEGLLALDIGPKTAEQYAAEIAAANTIFWNGPMGVFEFDAFASGTRAVANATASSGAWSVVGGGDSVRAIKESGRADEIDHVSTGGGASLEFIEGKVLPGLAALGFGKGETL